MRVRSYIYILPALVSFLFVPAFTFANTLTETTIILSPESARDIWTTSRYSYDGVNSGPGGGLDNGFLVVGGWGDLYYSFLRFGLADLPANVVSAHLELYSAKQRGVGNTPMLLDRVTQSWDWWLQGTGRDRERLWWADRPTATQIASLPSPTQNAWYSIDITDLYRQWQNGTFPNYGIQLRPVSISNTWNEFYSSDYADSAFLPRLVLVTEESSCTQDCNSNVLFLPGLEASRLYRPDSNGNTDQLWEPNTDSDVNDLFLSADGASVRNDVYTKDVIDEKNVLPVGQGNIYKSFITQMNSLKAGGVITDWEAVPYDWRLSLDDILNTGAQFPDGRIYYAGDLAATSSPYIIQELRRLAKSSKTGKVTIIAHSNGGLVAKALTEKLGSEASALIDKIIFVAVPQAGTPQAVGAILHGYDQGLPFDSTPLVLTPETARTLAENMPSAYNLLPSANYFTYVDDPVVTFDASDFLSEFRARYGSKIHDGAQLRNFITDTRRLASSSQSDLTYPSVGNVSLLVKAETAHDTLDNWTPPSGVSLYEIAGWGEDTLATIEYTAGKKTYCSDPGDIYTCRDVPTIIYNPKEVIEGDGTVVVPSALWDSASTTKKYWVNLREYDTVFNYEREHADILEVPELRTLIQSLITNSTSTLPAFTFITTTQPIADQSGDVDKRLRFVLHSPLSLSATDSLGNTISFATSTIPGSRFKRYGEVQVLTVPKNTPITLNLDGYATGSFTLDMQEIDGSNAIIASSTFSAIPSATSTTATISFTDGTLQGATPLLLDYDGNGTTDFSLSSKIGKTVVFDITPPEAVITFDPVSLQLNIIGSDNLSATTVSITATSTSISDEAGNTLQIVFKKFKQEKKELKLELQSLVYNGVSVGELSKTTLQYEWSSDKVGNIQELEEKATVGTLKIEGHYDAKKNVTKIKEGVRDEEDNDEKESEKTLLGLVIFHFVTDKGKVETSYNL
ncbi:MAG: DNRLRE domain-containing protein [bacterium]|nr:DNRLRE domain-containing protein [bacterium]MDO8742776.1 DNRLRE domain-containing protein [bacterium]